MAMSEFPFLFMTSAKTGHGRMMTMPWAEFVQLGHVQRADKDGAAYVAAEIPSGHRTVEDVESVTGVTLDIDGKSVVDGKIVYTDINPAAVLAALSDWRYVAWSTHSHMTATADHAPINKFRVLLPLAQPIGPESHRRLLAWVVERTGNVADPVVKDSCRLFYFPSCPPEKAQHAWIKHNEGPQLSIAVVPASYRHDLLDAPSARRTAARAAYVPREPREDDEDECTVSGIGPQVIAAFLELPAVLWAKSQPEAVSREVWRGFANQLCTVEREDPPSATLAREAFHVISKGYSGYTVAEADRLYDYELRHGRLVTVRHMLTNGMPTAVVPVHEKTLFHAAQHHAVGRPLTFDRNDPPLPKWTARNMKPKGWK